MVTASPRTGRASNYSVKSDKFRRKRPVNDRFFFLPTVPVS